MTEYSEPAFPIINGANNVFSGMSLRDYFAAAAMQGRLACGMNADGDSSNFEAAICYQIADAMIEERKVRSKK